MKICDLTLAELSARLSGFGIYLRYGPFVAHLQTSIPFVADFINSVYSEYPIEEPDVFADYHVRVDTPRGLRRWFRRQATFDHNGERPFNPQPLRQAVPLLEGGLNWCVFNHAHQYLMIHASVLERNGSAILLPAPSGSGKSTLCAGLACRGWRLLTDELALVSPADGCIVPLPRPVSLKNSSIGIIRNFAPEAKISPVWADAQNGLIAYMRPPSDALERVQEIAIPAWIIFINYVSGAAAELEPIPRCRAFLRLADNAINYSLLGTQGFETLSHVIDRTYCYSLSYGNLDEAVATLAELKPRYRDTGA